MACSEFKVTESQISNMKNIVSDLLKFHITTIESIINISESSDELIVNGLSSSIMKAILRSSSFKKKKEMSKKLSELIDLEDKL